MRAPIDDRALVKGRDSKCTLFKGKDKSLASEKASEINVSDGLAAVGVKFVHLHVSSVGDPSGHYEPYMARATFSCRLMRAG